MASQRRGSSKPSWIGAVSDDWSMYSDDSADYRIGEPIGFGASSIVYSAIYTPKDGSPIPCALKVVDLESLPPSALPLLTRETRLMSLSKHPNVLRVRGSWMRGHRLYIALRLMRKGSVRDVMRYKYTDGVEEEAVKCILKQALEGLNYLHVNGFIHRDVKAANLLVDDDGTVLLGDLGVAASLSEDHEPVMTPAYHYSTRTSQASSIDIVTPKIISSTPIETRIVGPASRAHVGKRKSFVGTPCWMAPEVVAQKHYDAKADIYSLGITALELTHGRAPHSRDPPHKALLKTLQNDSPTLDRSGGANKYSRGLKEVIDACLAKDPNMRPTCAHLLSSPFFKTAKKKGYLVGTLLSGLPPLADRQERRKQPSIPSAPGSRESWNFASTPRSSAHSKVVSATGGTPPRRSQNVLPPESVFEMEDEGWAGTGTELPIPDPTLVAKSPLSSNPPHAASPNTSPRVSNESATHSPTASDRSHTRPVLQSAPTGSSGPLSARADNVSTSVPHQGGMWKKLTGRGRATSDYHGKGDGEKKVKEKTSSGGLGGFLERTTSRSWAK